MRNIATVLPTVTTLSSPKSANCNQVTETKSGSAIFTWCEVLCFVNHQHRILIKLRSAQLPQLQIAIMRHLNLFVFQVFHLFPHSLRIVGKRLSSNSIVYVTQSHHQAMSTNQHLRDYAHTKKDVVHICLFHFLSLAIF